MKFYWTQKKNRVTQVYGMYTTGDQYNQTRKLQASIKGKTVEIEWLPTTDIQSSNIFKKKLGNTLTINLEKGFTSCQDSKD